MNARSPRHPGPRPAVNWFKAGDVPDSLPLALCADACNDWSPRLSVTSPSGQITLVKLIIALMVAALVMSGCGTFYAMAR